MIDFVVDATSSDGLQALRVLTRWPVDALAGAEVVNQFIAVPALTLQDGSVSGDFYLVTGIAHPPLYLNDSDLVDTPEGGKAAAVPVEPRSRLYLTRERAIELRDMLSSVIDELEPTTKESGQ